MSEKEKEEKLKRLFDYIAEEQVVYHMVNGEIKVIDPVLKELIETAILEEKPALAFQSDVKEEGHMNNQLYIFNNFAVLKSYWCPAAEYSWEEEEIVLYKFIRA